MALADIEEAKLKARKEQEAAKQAEDKQEPQEDLESK